MGTDLLPLQPRATPVKVKLSLLAGGDIPPVYVERTLAPGAVTRIRTTEMDGVPFGVPFVVQATGDGPFVAQMCGRAFTRGLAHVRAMYSFIGIPMALTQSE